MRITDASLELYQTLRAYDEVVGTAVVSKNDKPYIVIYLEKATKAILDKIPPSYKGNQVKTEISGSFFSF
ncbi:hypothetical protein SIO70_00655 [Chitinophaga sancti]|uniref:hypothetical protein n=1 Tax=Chitinophaga sancti TaxID=1004 RepID=UPI002A75FC2A|nr:hypothetical protein [Chitinophaga sancti]WPQ63371.1 hypothetical protein SIO70_00655 [Chitinophaga sancti]